MKAVRVHELGGLDALVYEDAPSPELPPGHVRLRVRAVGLNFPDLLMTQGLYQFRPELPFSPGFEAAGVVLEVAEDVPGLSPGDRVTGFSTHGAMAEEMVVPAYGCFPIPDGIDFATAAAMTVTYGTSYHALVDRARLASDETLLVTGATGGVGSAAVQLGKALGARVIATVGSTAKTEVASNLGADHVIDLSEHNLREGVKALTNGRGADVIYEPVGGSVFLDTLRCVAWGGRILVVGFASGVIPEAPMNLALLKGSSIVGVFWGEFARLAPDSNHANTERIFQLLEEGRIDPLICATFPLPEARQGLAMLAERRATGKVVVTVGD